MTCLRQVLAYGLVDVSSTVCHDMTVTLYVMMAVLSQFYFVTDVRNDHCQQEKS